MRGIIQRIRQPIDRALDRVVNWLVGMARRFVRGNTEEGGQAGNFSEQFMWDSIAEQVSGQPTPETRLTISSADFNRSVLQNLITSSSATQARKLKLVNWLNQGLLLHCYQQMGMKFMLCFNRQVGWLTVCMVAEEWWKFIIMKKLLNIRRLSSRLGLVELV
ncbi:MAG: hypothetical protein IPM82_25975 [Saprospiraceae bacterium]|nr:hypothetical protein [Saprospiraceae bacterium]